jgi:tetratricopeptide (TPR) repeat protein
MKNSGQLLSISRQSKKVVGAGPAVLIAAMVSLIFFCSFVQADTIFLKSIETIRGVTVVEFSQGQLETINKKGGRKTVNFDDIACVRVDGEPDLNDAERLLRLKNGENAVRAYRKVLAKTDRKKSWIKHWAQVRLMNQLARQGQIDDAAEVYIELAGEIPDWVLSVSPTPQDFKTTSATLDLAGAKLVKARDESKSGKVREALAKFYQRLGCEKKLPEAKPIVTVNAGDEKDFDKFDQPGPWLDAWAEARIKSGHPDAVL